jgi:ribonucleoside-diphosphate reductase beta chain
MAILDTGFNISLRPMKYPQFYEAFVEAQANNWSVQEISFSTDITDLKQKLSPEDKHVVSRIVAFFANGDAIVNDNACLALYKHVNNPEARLYYSRQIFEESLHIQFYLTLLDNYVPDINEREAMFKAIETVPSVKRKAEWALKWSDEMNSIPVLETDEHRRTFLKNLIAFATCVEGLFFFGAFAYVYYLRDKGLLHGLASGTNWVFRDESCHMKFAFSVIDVIKVEYPHLWDARMENDIREMIAEAIECEMQFAEDTLTSNGILGLSPKDMRQYLECTADSHFVRLGLPKVYNSKNPFDFMIKQDVQSLTNFFERTVAEYSVGIGGDIDLDADDF